jgi:hypothetical protein
MGPRASLDILGTENLMILLEIERFLDCPTHSLVTIYIMLSWLNTRDSNIQNQDIKVDLAV